MSEDAQDADAVARLRDAAVPAALRALPEILMRLPAAPGVYLMKDARGKPLYIGKAANLRARVRQYFQPGRGDDRDFVPLLERIVADIETVVTGNEKEALLLENTLIKRHRPRFNIKLRDDKNYLVLRLDPRAEWPRLEVGRRMADDGAHYFGPYHSATACRQTLRVVNRHFKLRTCTDHVLHNRRRPCLQHQIQRCPAPCVLPVSRDDYGEQVRDVRLFLEGKDDELLGRLRARMQAAAARREYEQAALVRDQMRALETTLQGQRAVASAFVDQDVVGFHRDGVAVEIAVLIVRQGKIVGTETFGFREQEFPDAEILSSFLGLYYDLKPDRPDEVLLPFAIDDADLKAEWLSEGRPEGRKVEVLVPRRGPRSDIVRLAVKNAAASHVSRRGAGGDAALALAKLQRRLKLPRPPRVIECYDVSHVQGTEVVASLVVFVDGRPDKARYRTFKLRHGRGNDDFASMHEVLSRRLRRARARAASWELPDLIVVDGGKGQLAVALAAARDVGVDTSPGAGLPIVALAKRTDDPDGPPDRVFLPHGKDAIPIRPHSAEMFVLQQIRDEAHRFAVAFHRAQRRRRTLRSALADVRGIGAGRQRILLRHFGSLKKVREASVDDLAAAPGMTRAVAEAVYAHFAARPAPRAGDQVAAAEEAEADAVESAFAGVDDAEGDDATRIAQVIVRSHSSATPRTTAVRRPK